MVHRNNLQKELKQEFLSYLEQRIPSYRMPASKFFSSFNTSLKNFAKTHGIIISSILDIDDIEELIRWLGQLGQNDNVVFNPKRRESKAQEGLKYYIDFLKSKSSHTSTVASSSDESSEEEFAEDIIEHATEGMMKEETFFRRKRNRAIRDECARLSGYKCYVCGMDFEKVYGSRGHEFIEVHHTKPLATYDGEHDIPLDELRALCSNCHSMVHHGKSLLSVEELKELYNQNKYNRELY